MCEARTIDVEAKEKGQRVRGPSKAMRRMRSLFFLFTKKKTSEGRNRKQIIIKVTANATLPRHLLALGLTMRKKRMSCVQRKNCSNRRGIEPRAKEETKRKNERENKRNGQTKKRKKQQNGARMH